MTSPTSAQQDLLSKLVGESGRRTSVQLAGEFAWQEGGDTALGRLVRAGEATLKLYLTLVLATRQPPHQLWRYWSGAKLARMLGLDASPHDDHTSNGTRAIQRALKQLETKGFITTEKKPGYAPTITVHHVGDEDSRRSGRFASIPVSLWRNGWILVMSKRALAVYVALRRECKGNESGEPFHVTARTQANYGFSADTWKRGERELLALGLLEIGHGSAGGRNDLERNRRLYKLQSKRLEAMPGKAG